MVILNRTTPIFPPFDCQASCAFSDGVAWFKTSGLWYAVSDRKKESNLADRMDDQAKGVVSQVTAESEDYFAKLAESLGITEMSPDKRNDD